MHVGGRGEEGKPSWPGERGYVSVSETELSFGEVGAVYREDEPTALGTQGFGKALEAE